MESNKFSDMSQEDKNRDVDIDIYGDVCDFDLGEEIEKLKIENRKLEEHVRSLNEAIDKLNGTIIELKETQNNLTKNISSLFVTAQAEIERKNRIIEELREQVDSYSLSKFNKGRAYKRKDREKSPLEVNNSKKCKYDDNVLSNVLEIDQQEPKWDDRREYRSNYVSDRETQRDIEDDNNQYRSKYSNEKYIDQSRSRYESRSGYSTDRYNESDSRSKYYNSRYSSYEDDGYYSRSKISYGRYYNENEDKRSYDRYDSEYRDRYDTEAQHYSGIYNNTTNRVSERDEVHGDKSYRNYNRNSWSTSEDRSVNDRDKHRYEEEIYNNYTSRRPVEHYDFTYYRNEQSKTSERSYTPPIRDMRERNCPNKQQVTLHDIKNAEVEEGRRSVTPMPTEEDIEETKTKPPKKRLKMLEEMEKKVKQNRLSQASNSFSEENDDAHTRTRQSFDNKSKHSLSHSRNDSDRYSVTSNKSTNSNKSWSQKEMHKKDSKHVTGKVSASHNLELSKINEKPKVSPNKTKKVPRKTETQKTKSADINIELKGDKNNASKPVPEKSTRKEENKCIKYPKDTHKLHDDRINAAESKHERSVKVEVKSQTSQELKLCTENLVQCPLPNQNKYKDKSSKPPIKIEEVEANESNKDVAIDLRKDTESREQKSTKNAVIKEGCNKENNLFGIFENSDMHGAAKEPHNIKTTKHDILQSGKQNLEQKLVSFKDQISECSEKLKEPTTDLNRENKSKDGVFISMLENDKPKNEGEKNKRELLKSDRTVGQGAGKNQNKGEMKQERKGNQFQHQNEKKGDITKVRKNEVALKVSKGHESKEHHIKVKNKENMTNSAEDANENKDKHRNTNIQDSVILSKCTPEKTKGNVEKHNLIKGKEEQSCENKMEIKNNERATNSCGKLSAQLYELEKEAKDNETAELKNDSKYCIVKELKEQSDSNKKAVQQELEQKIKSNEPDLKPKRKSSISIEQNDVTVENKFEKLDECAVKQNNDYSDCKITKDKILERKESYNVALNIEIGRKQSVKEVKDLLVQDSIINTKCIEEKKIEEKSAVSSKKYVEKVTKINTTVVPKDNTEVSSNREENHKKDIIEFENPSTSKKDITENESATETQINIKQNEPRNRLNEVKRRIRFSTKEVTIINQDLTEKSDCQTVQAKIAAEKDSKCATSEIQKSALKKPRSQRTGKKTIEGICDALKNANKSDQENKVNTNKNATIITKNKSDNSNFDKDKKETLNTTRPSNESFVTSLEDHKSTIKVTKSENKSKVLTASSPGSDTDSEDDSLDDIFNQSKIVHKLIEINNIEQEKAKPIETVASLSDSSSDDTIVMCNSDNTKIIDQKFDNLIKNYIENLTVVDKKSNSEKIVMTDATRPAAESDNLKAPANESSVTLSKENVVAETTEPKVKVLEVISIVNASDKIVKKMPHVQNSPVNLSKYSADVQKLTTTSSGYDTFKNQAGGSNFVRSTPKRRITPTPVRDDKPLCSFENILTKTCQPEPFPTPTVTQNGESPLHLTHEGEIPVLHLEENHINNLPTEININDKNIINLLDTMNISNIDCDIPKFKNYNDAQANPGTSVGGGSTQDGLTFENIIEKVTPVPVNRGEIKNDVKPSWTSNDANTDTSLSSDKVTGSRVQPGATPLPTPRRRRRCRLVIRD